MRTRMMLPLLLALGACGPDGEKRFPYAEMATPPPARPAPTPQVVEPEPPPRPTGPLPLDVDPVAEGLTADGITGLCDRSLAQAKLHIDEIRALKAAPDDKLTWEATLGKLDAATLAIRNAGDFPQLIAVAHPDKAVREAAKTCDPKIEKFSTALYLDADLASVFKRFAARKLDLPRPRARLLEHTLRDYRRNGLELPAEKQTRLKELNEKITKLSQEFESNIAGSTLSIEVSPEQLKGLPDSYIASHKPGDGGKIKITTDYPDYFPFLQYAEDRAAAFELYKKFDNRAADKNIKVLEELLKLRDEKARLLGYKTWADYIIEPRMARDAKTVAGFLDGLRKHIKAKGAEEFRDFEALYHKRTKKKGEPPPISDRTYLEDQVRKEKFGVDSKEVSNYFEVNSVKKGILDITSKLFNITYRPIRGATWHTEVESMEVLSDGKVIGRFYFDLYPRPDKYKHAAVFSIRETYRDPDGKRLMPIAAIVCNFPKTDPSGGAPGLMSHGDVATFFHEFGHVLHHLLSESELASFAGTSVPRDFVEAPSQMLEEWAWSKETLDLFARHHKTNEPLPDKLFQAMKKARGFGRAVSTQRQLFLASLDQAYHTRPPGADTTKIVEEVQNANMPFKYVPDTHFQATFGHLIGYDAGYYGYQWALSISRDLFSRFQREGMMNEKTAADYRAAVLSQGGSDDADKLVERFLGRPPSDEPYRRFLVGDERPMPERKAAKAKGDKPPAPPPPKGDKPKGDKPKGDKPKEAPKKK